MAFALISDAHAQASVNTTVSTGGIDTTGANLIVVVVANYPNPTISPTDNKGNAYTQVVRQAGASSQYCAIFYKAAPTVGTGHAFTYSQGGPACYPSIHAYSFSGAAASPLDQTSSAAIDGATSGQPGSITPPQNGCLFIAGDAAQFATNNFGVNSGFTLSSYSGAVPAIGSGAAYLIQGSAAAVNPTWSWAGGTRGALVMATFKPLTFRPWYAAQPSLSVGVGL